MKNPPILSRAFGQRLVQLLDMVVDAFKPQNLLAKNALRVLCFLPALRLAYLNYNYEHRVGIHQHVKIASQWILAENAQSLISEGAEKIPDFGPLLVVCNHAGMGDALAVYATLPRTDTYTMVFLQGLLLGLPNFAQYCIVIDKQNPSVALRETVRHLKQGRTVLMFPRGEIEADPGLYIESALKTVEEWSESILFLAKHVPDLTVAPVAVGGVISRRALKNPLVRLYKNQNDRNFLAATFQLMLPIYTEPIVSVMYGNVLCGDAVTMTNIHAELRHNLQQIHTQQTQFVAMDRLIPMKD